MNPLLDSALKNLDGLDPYLIWGAFTQFRGTVGTPSAGSIRGNERVQFLIECADTFAARWIPNPKKPFSNEHGAISAHRVADGKVSGDGIYSVSAAISDVFSLLSQLGVAIRRIELSTARKAPRDSSTLETAPSLSPPAKSSKKNVLVIIDDGLAFLNTCFRTSAGQTAVAWFWDQSIEKTAFPTGVSYSFRTTSSTPFKPAPGWQPVYRFGYGRELTASAINMLIQSLDSTTSERLVYQRLDYTRVRRDLAHGTHVAGPVLGMKTT